MELRTPIPTQSCGHPISKPNNRRNQPPRPSESITLIVILAIFFCTVLIVEVNGDQYEYKLYEHLMKDYDPLERPVENNSNPVVVKLIVILQQIVGLDEKNQVLETNVWLKFSWTDYKLKWDPKIFGGVTDVRFPTEGVQTIWKPDVLVYNSADSNFDTTYHSNLVVYNDGTVNWIPPGILKTSCKVDITWFPFDDQNCYIKFGSWTYHGFALDLQPGDAKGMQMSEYLENGEWLILGAPVNRSEKFYDCCPEPYPDLKFYLQIRRRTLYYGFNLIIPSLLMAVMTILGFSLPPDACEKITLEITILLSVCFFLGIVAAMTPPTSEAVPLLGTFFTCCMVLVSCSVVFAVFVLNLHFRTEDTHEITPFVRAILLNWLPWLLMMRRPGHKFSRHAFWSAFGCGKEEDDEQQPSESLMQNIRFLEEAGQGQDNGRNRTDHKKDSIDLETRISRCLKPYLENPDLVDPGLHGMMIHLQMVHVELKFITARMEREDDASQVESDWKFAAMVVDRLCLFLFSIFLIGSTCGVMFSAPHLAA